MHLATAAFDMLAAKHGDRLEAEFQVVAGFELKPLAMARQVMRIAALLHDVGHAAFSHAAEEAVHKDLGHENLSVHLITKPEFLGSTLNGLYGDGFSDRVAQVLLGPPTLPPQLQVLKDLVSGEMDADRSDYLIRDSHHCGVNYGRFEYLRLIESIELDSDGGRLELALHRDGLHAFEALILARYQMNTQVYYHRLRRVYDAYLINYHQALGPTEFDTPEKIIAQNDMTMLARIMVDAKSDEKPGSRWAKRIAQRRHHKVVFEPGIHIVGGHDLTLVPKVLKDLQDTYDGTDFFVDAPKKPIRIHKLLMPNEEADAGVDMMLVSAAGDRKPIVRASQIFSTIPKSFRQIRIFGDVDSKGKRKEMSQFAAAKWAAYGGTV
jgi:HD superfamily phosphohydrolase